jgi:hypothetical protein
MKQKFTNLAWTLVIALIAILGGLGLFAGQGAQAAPPAAPTPVANILDTDNAVFFNFQTATALTADANTTGIEVLPFDSLDVQVVADVTIVTEPNTTTLTIQYSNDGSNWSDGLALATSLATDTVSITRVPVFGRYMRVEQDVSLSDPITITLSAVGR